MISYVEQTKILGVIIDDRLKFNLHIIAMCKKLIQKFTFYHVTYIYSQLIFALPYLKFLFNRILIIVFHFLFIYLIKLTKLVLSQFSQNQ